MAYWGAASDDPQLPLVFPAAYDSSFKVIVHLKSPLWSSRSSTLETAEIILSLCVQMDRTVRRRNIAQDQGDSSAYDTASWQITHLVERCGVQLEQRLPGTSLAEYMEDSDLETLCPRAYAVVTRQAVPGDRTLADDYFSTLANLNTMVTMSAQILDDLERGHHKYLAHQMAMLYQCVTNVGDCTAHFRKEIEAMFPKIKAATRVIPGAPKTPKLPAHLSSWLEATVGRLVAQVHDLDGTMALPIEPVVDWLAEQH